MASLSQQIPFPAIMAQVEAIEVRRAVEFALELSITIATVEGDLDTIYKELINSDLSLALHRHLIQDVKLLVSSFDCISFTHIR